MRHRAMWTGAITLVAGLSLIACTGGSSDGGSASTTKAPPPKKPEPPALEAGRGPDGPLPTLLAVQAHFTSQGGKTTPLPAKLIFLRKDGDTWWREEIQDPESNVFHKAIAWRDGVLTIGAEVAPKPATLKHWTRGDDGSWTAETLWSVAWEGTRFNRLRDLEIGDVDGDGKDDLVIATHDKGVVAVGREGESGWTFTEMDATADTFVHEVEIGDVDGDGKPEFYVTPSDRNKASGVSQPGGVRRYDPSGDTFVGAEVVHWDESHAKEILVHDLDGDGTDELYVVLEAHIVKDEAGKKQRVDPVRIVRAAPGPDGTWTKTVVAELDDDQCRFLVPGDVDGDGQDELIAAGFKSGLWRLEPQADGTLKPELIDADSSGFEHATHVADLDGDGALEIYVAADDQKLFRVYSWSGTGFDRAEVAPIGPARNSHITWNLQDGTF